MGATDIKELAGRYSPDEIEACINDQVLKGDNVCSTGASHRAMLNDLAQAQVVKDLMENGMSLQEALREVARRIRNLAKGGGL